MLSQARQSLGFLPHAFPLQELKAPAVDVVSAVDTACPSWLPQQVDEGANEMAAELPLLDTVLISRTSLSALSVSVGAEWGSITADALAEIVELQQLHDTNVTLEPPSVADLCPSDVLVAWIAKPAPFVDCAPCAYKHAVQRRLLAEAGFPGAAVAVARGPHSLLPSSKSQIEEPGLEQLVLPPTNTALLNGPCGIDTLLRELGCTARPEEASPVIKPPPVVAPGCPTFEQFAALALRLDGMQPPTLPQPEEMDTEKASRDALHSSASSRAGAGDGALQAAAAWPCTCPTPYTVTTRTSVPYLLSCSGV